MRASDGEVAVLSDSSEPSSENIESDNESVVGFETSKLRKSLHLPNSDCLNVDNNLDTIHSTMVNSKKAQSDFIEKLHSCNIEVTWILPELHKLSTQTVRLPEKNVRNQIITLGLPLRKGKFTPEEDKILAKNWRKLCRKFNLPDVPQALTSWRNKTNDSSLAKTRRTTVLWLARGLNNRTPAQVFQRFSHTLGANVKGRFSKEHLELIEYFMQNKLKQHTQQHLASMLGRDERSVYRCIKLLKNKNPEGKQRQIVWNLEICEIILRELISIVADKNCPNSKELTTENVEMLKTVTITAQNWKDWSTATSFPVVSLKNHWRLKLYNQLFSPNQINTKPIVLKIIKIFKERGYKHWSDIDWKKTAQEFEFLKSTLLWKIYYLCVLKYCKSKIKCLKDTVDYLYDNFVVGDCTMMNQRLKRLEVIDGKLHFF